MVGVAAVPEAVVAAVVEEAAVRRRGLAPILW
jgi:hypothetical protein